MLCIIWYQTIVSIKRYHNMYLQIVTLIVMNISLE